VSVGAGGGCLTISGVAEPVLYTSPRRLCGSTIGQVGSGDCAEIAAARGVPWDLRLSGECQGVVWLQYALRDVWKRCSLVSACEYAPSSINSHTIHASPVVIIMRHNLGTGNSRCSAGALVVSDLRSPVRTLTYCARGLQCYPPAFPPQRGKANGQLPRSQRLYTFRLTKSSYAAAQATVRRQTSANLRRVAHFSSCTSLHSLSSQIKREVTRRSVTVSRPRVDEQSPTLQTICSLPTHTNRFLRPLIALS
jgi:hypothetical protein